MKKKKIREKRSGPLNVVFNFSDRHPQRGEGKRSEYRRNIIREKGKKPVLSKEGGVLPSCESIHDEESPSNLTCTKEEKKKKRRGEPYTTSYRD